VRHGRRLFANLRKAIVFIVAVHVPIVGLSIVPVLLGWPMLLMPVHIMFLQLVIDPACSIVFEAEPIEAHAMSSPPRRLDMRLFDREILLRGLLQGGGLLLMLCGLYVQVRGGSQSDAMARTATFVALVLANLALIYTNRTWSRPSWMRRDAPNQSFAWISLATVLLLLLVLSWETLRGLFAFARPGAPQLVAAAFVAAASVGWFELIKWVMTRRTAALK
jgi:Ca2+-transporting ATPase